MTDLSIIVPVYNTAIDKLENCFQSIKKFISLNDDLMIECLIIDDGSFGEISDWCCRFSESNPTFKFHKKKNEGVSVARNLGIELSRGKYLLFVDSDDILISSFKVGDYLSIDKYDLIFSNLALDIHLSNVWQAFEGNSREIDAETVISRLVSDGTLNGPVCKIIRKDLLEQYHINFKETMITGEDLVFLIQVLLSKPKMYYISQCTYIYNLDKSTSNSRLKNNVELFIENNAVMYENMLQLIEECAYHEKQLQFRKSATERYVKQLFNSSADLLEMGLLTQNIKDYINSSLSRVDQEIVKVIKKNKLSKANFHLAILLKQRWWLLAIISKMRIIYSKFKNRL